MWGLPEYPLAELAGYDPPSLRERRGKTVKVSSARVSSTANVLGVSNIQFERNTHICLQYDPVTQCLPMSPGCLLLAYVQLRAVTQCRYFGPTCDWANLL